jgi:hypothetical protein
MLTSHDKHEFWPINKCTLDFSHGIFKSDIVTFAFEEQLGFLGFQVGVTLFSSKLNYANKCLSRARVSLWRLKQKQARSTEYSEKKPCGGICREVDALPPTAKQFIVSQVRALSASPFGMRWSHQDKLLALGLYYKSPSAYRFMRRTFHLPSERTLQQYISGFNVTTGFIYLFI